MNVLRELRPSAIIIDDEREIVGRLERILKQMDHFKSILTAYDGLEAARKLDLQEFDLIVTDINMPKIDGLQLMKRFENAPDNVIVMSGDFHSSHVKEAKEIGIKNFLAKPFDRELFVERVKQVCKIKD